VTPNACVTARIDTPDSPCRSAVRTAELLIGKAVPVLGVPAAQQAIVLGSGVVFFGMPVAAPGLLVAACAAWGLARLGMGTAVGRLVRSYGQLSAAFDIGALFLTTLGGALVPLSTLPGWVRVVSRLSPGCWAAQSLRHAAAGDPGPTFTGAGVLLAVAAGTGAIAAWRVAPGWGRATAGYAGRTPPPHSTRPYQTLLVQIRSSRTFAPVLGACQMSPPPA
jgi:ABC-2 type transport system permease protein